MKLRHIRSAFLDFFAKQQHQVVPSSSLVPHNDPSLMFTNAGMVQFKNYFTGQETPSYHKAASSQKCVRAGGKHNDLDNVGYTARHHTFFEMLGNFSFGDYFKEEAIYFAWQFLTQELQLDPAKLYVTVYHTDDEAFNLWQKITGFNSDKIIRIATNDNFWAMGDTGPCGPCSEIFFDNGPDVQGGLPGTTEQDGDRYKEIWNLVFMQFEDLPGGQRIALPKPSIDTGMGLERLAAVLQGKLDNYDTDLFRALIARSEDITGNRQNAVSHRVIADHIRASAFLIADGVMPSNEGRGYVLRRIMRRAMRHLYHLGAKEPMFYQMLPTLIAEMGSDYEELTRASATISSVIKLEEEKFITTLGRGMQILQQEIADTNIHSNNMFSGVSAFKLYDTYGFPLDLTVDILRGHNIEVNMQEFHTAMQEQKDKARSAWIGSGEKATEQIWLQIRDKFGATEFTGYSNYSGIANVIALVQDGQIITEGRGEIWVVCNQTPFYAESGGQVGDTGSMNNCEVIDTQKFAGDVIAHKVLVIDNIKIGNVVTLEVDKQKRKLIIANHSAAHIAHHALRKILGEHVTQKGSLVNEKRMRFDFSHPKAVSSNELVAIEQLCNLMVMNNYPVITELMDKEAAIKKGAMALFGEKYGAEVRVVTMGESVELCGGIHVSHTGEIGSIYIIKEEAVASGVRRIEVLTGMQALAYQRAEQQKIQHLQTVFKTPEIVEKATLLLEQNKQMQKKIQHLAVKLALQEEHHVVHKNGTIYMLQHVDLPASEGRAFAEAKQQQSPGILFFTSLQEGKLLVVLSVYANLAEHAAEMLQQLAARFSVKSGGNKAMAQMALTGISYQEVHSAFIQLIKG